MPTFGGIVVATGAEAGGRRSLLDIVDELSRPIDASDSTVRALAGDAFRAAVRRMNIKGCWPWELMDEDISITANLALSTVASAVKKPLAMHLLNASGGVRDERLTYERYDVFIERYDQNVTSDPTVYTIPNLFETGQIRWFPIPAHNDNARFTFYRVTPIPKVESEPVEIPEYAIETYITLAQYELFKRLPASRQPFPIVVAREDAQRAFREMSAHVNSPGDRSRDISNGRYT